MSGSEDDGESALQHACGEARHTINHQIEKIHNEDDKAIGISRLNLLVLGVLASGLSLSIRTDQVATLQFLNAHVVLGTLSLVVSTVVASMAYTSSQFEMGLGSDPIEKIADGSISDGDYFEKLGEEYPKWVRNNHKVHRFNSYAITWSLIYSISGFLLFIGGLVIAILGLKGEAISYILLLVEIIAILIVGFCLYYSDQLFETIMKFQNNS